MDLPFTRGLRDTLAPPRAAAVTVVMAPPAFMPATIYAPAVRATEEAMIGTMQDLRIDVVEKNAEMEAALASLVMRCEAAFTRLNDVISPSRNARLADARSGIEGSFVQLVAEVSVDTASRFANVVSALEGPQRILDTTTAREEHLYNTQVFQEFEAACGESLRQMERSHFEFDMDKLSTVDREKKINARFDQHCDTYIQRGVDETADRSVQFSSLATAFASGFSVLEASAVSSESHYTAAIRFEEGILATEAAARETGDSAFAVNMVSALARIRVMALDAFGDNENNEENEENSSRA